MTASIYDIPVSKISGEDASLAEFKGKVLLVVNVASKCGLTAQYEGLEGLYERLKGQGLVVAGFPANNFKSQEPGSDQEIQSFCTPSNFGVKFPMFSKVNVVGPEKHPLYAALIAAQPKAIAVNDVPFAEKLHGYGIETNAEPEILWNFEKFVVSRSGQVVKRFAPDTLPDAPELVAAIEAELAKTLKLVKTIGKSMGEIESRSLNFSIGLIRSSALRSLPTLWSIGQEEPKYRTGADLAAHHDLRVVLVQDSLRYPEPQSCPRFALRRHEWMKEAIQRSGAHAFSGVRHRHAHSRASIAVGRRTAPRRSAVPYPAARTAHC